MIVEWLPVLSLIGGMGGGFVAGRLGRRPAAVAVRPVCPCDHVISSHEGPTNGGACREEIRRAHYMTTGDRNGSEWVRCPCLRYCGPELLSAYQVRGIATTDVPPDASSER